MTNDGGEPDLLRRRMELGQIIDRSLTLYRLNFPELVAMAAVTLPIDIVSALAAAAITDAVILTVVSIPLYAVSIAVTVVATAAIARAVDDIADGRLADFNRGYRYVAERLRTLMLAALRVFLPVVLAAVTVVGIPLAVYLLVRWIFFPQTVAIDDLGSKDAADLSARIVKGQWWRTFGILLVVWALAGLPALAVAVLFAPAAVIASGLASAAVAVIILPFVAVASTLLYYDLRSRERESAGTT